MIIDKFALLLVSFSEDVFARILYFAGILRGIYVNFSKDDSQLTPAPSQPALAEKPPTRHDPYQAMRFTPFRLLFFGTFFAAVGEQMLTIAIGWELYERTDSAFLLGLVGLVQVLPALLLSLPAGHLADQLNRKRIVIIAQTALVFSSVALTALSYYHGSLVLIYTCLFIIGCAVAFQGPASSALFGQVIPTHVFENAATWWSGSWQLAAVIGPALGGVVIALAHSATPVYALNALAALLFILLLIPMRTIAGGEHTPERMTLSSLFEGLRYLRSTQVLLAAITLDLFAVLLGGATMLLPIFAKDILHVGPTYLGWLRAAPSVGAVCAALGIAFLPPFKKAGRTLLWAVAGFGLATVVFGLSTSFWLSMASLFVLGALDNVSVVIRSTLLLMRTPDAMRGRISAVNSLFISASNELGGFESGAMAQLFGPVLAVVGGGIGTILVVLLVALLWPEMRRLGTLREKEGL